MNRLELGKYWLERFCLVMPAASVRMRTRMAWHLAALKVLDDDGLARVPDTALSKISGGSPHFLGLRELYLHQLQNCRGGLCR